MSAELFTTDEAREGMTAFLEAHAVVLPPARPAGRVTAREALGRVGDPAPGSPGAQRRAMRSPTSSGMPKGSERSWSSASRRVMSS